MYAWRNMQAVMSLDFLATIGEHDEVLSLFTCHAEILFVPSLFLSTYFNGYSSNLKFLKTLLYTIKIRLKHSLEHEENLS